MFRPREKSRVLHFVLCRGAHLTWTWIAGATFRAQASHLLNRVARFFGGGESAEDGNAPRPGFRRKADEERGYDAFDDAYSRFAGRGAWGRGFNAERL